MTDCSKCKYDYHVWCIQHDCGDCERAAPDLYDPALRVCKCLRPELAENCPDFVPKEDSDEKSD